MALLNRPESTVPALSPYAAAIAATPVVRSSVRVCGGTTQLWRYGSDDATRDVIFLHGFRGDHHGLEPVVARLVAARPDLRITVPDLPGFGGSSPLKGTRHDLEGYAAWTNGLLAELAQEGEVVLAGHSFGSVVAAAAMASDDDAVGPVDQLVLVNPIPRPPLSGSGVVSVGSTAVLHRLAGILPDAAGSWILRHPLLTRVASVAMVRTPDRDLRRWIHEEHGRYFAGFATRRSLLEAFDASIRESVLDAAAHIHVPTLLIGGARDDLARVPHQRALAARFPDATLRLIPGVGHLTHYETPGQVAAEIAGFLTGSR
ncbi:alpha/beta hydrolase [Myceligenerans crystallogenes]|uniref:Alpha/beta hydrolase n=1 Tax=Myceligenerans crystallogenes TaxID=316335 RepID=A0ABP4ZDE7_9MICO